DGTASAKEVYGRVTWRVPGEKVGFRPVGGECHSNAESMCAFTRSASLHPGIGGRVFALSWNLQHRVIDENWERGFIPGDSPPFIRLELFCENQEPQTIE